MCFSGARGQEEEFCESRIGEVEIMVLDALSKIDKDRKVHGTAADYWPTLREIMLCACAVRLTCMGQVYGSRRLRAHKHENATAGLGVLAW